MINLPDWSESQPAQNKKGEENCLNLFFSSKTAKNKLYGIYHVKQAAQIWHEFLIPFLTVQLSTSLHFLK